MAALRPVRTLLVVLAALALLAAACGDDGSEDVASNDVPGEPGPTEIPPGRPVEYIGEITSVSVFEPVTEDCVDPADRAPDEPVSSDDPPSCTDPDTAPLGTVLVEEVPGVQEGDKISLRIDDATALFRTTGGGPGGTVEPITFADLAEGDQVDAWVDGPVADSYPQQGGAQAILVTG